MLGGYARSETSRTWYALLFASSDGIERRFRMFAPFWFAHDNKGAEKATRDAANGYNNAFWIVLSIIAAAIIAGVAVGFYLVRDVSNGIASIVKPMQALGSGDLSAEVPHRGEQTEIGAMADTLAPT